MAKGKTPVAVVQEEGGTFAIATAPNVPGPAAVLIVVQEGASADEVLAALSAARGFDLSYGLPKTAAELARRWPKSTARVARLEIPILSGAPERTMPAPSKPARWETSEGPRTEEQLIRHGVKALPSSAADRAKQERERNAPLKRELAEERAKREALEAELRAAQEGASPPGGEGDLGLAGESSATSGRSESSETEGEGDTAETSRRRRAKASDTAA